MQAVTAGFEEPYAVSAFLGNVVDFSVPESREITGKGYSGLLYSQGTYHIKDNVLIRDDWWEGEWTVKGDRRTPDRKLSWSFRVGAKLHGHRYVVEAAIQLTELDDSGIAFDFADLKAALKTLADIHIKTIPTLHQHFLVLFPVLLNALFFDGILLSKLLGLCPLINKSRQIDAAWKMGIAVIMVTTLSTALNWIVYEHILVRGSDFLSHYSPIPLRLENIFYLTVFIVTIAVFVQILSVLLRKFAKNVYEQMGQFLELITVNCIVLAGATFTIPTGAKFLVTTVTAFGYGLHWMMVVVWLAVLRRQRLFVPTNVWDEDTIAILLLGIMAAIFTGIGMIQIF